MENIIYSLQNLQIHEHERITRTNTLDQNTHITKDTLIKTCLQLYHENATLKKEIQRLTNPDCISEPKIPKWVH